MPTLMYDPETDQMIAKEDYLQAKYLRTADKQMMVGNQRVSFYYNADEMPPTRHMVDGKYYTSKKKFRNETRARNCIEVGNETKITQRKRVNPDRRERRETIRQVVHALKNAPRH